MTSFLEDVILDLQNKSVDISQITFVLPSKRSGTFLKKLIGQHSKKAVFLPEILSIETFIEALSDLEYAQNIELLFEFYSAYLSITPKEECQPFDEFSKWAQILIHDFNEIDRYLINSDALFNYLGAIKELNHWSLAKEQTTLVKNYIAFWNRLPLLYAAYKAALLTKKKGYQGMVYSEAVNNLEQYLAVNQGKHFVFVGFNALSKAEEIILQELLQQGLASIYWDIDESFINDPIHEAGLFARHYKYSWPYFVKNEFNWIAKSYSLQKSINVIGTPKHIGQVKYVGELLQTLDPTEETLSNTAIILGDENLLLPLLNSIPNQINAINITMGMPLKSVPMASLFENLFKLHKTTAISFYHKDVMAILSDPYIKPLLVEEGISYSDLVGEHIQENNVVYLNLWTLNSICPSKEPLLALLFDPWNNSANTAIEHCIKLILKIKASLAEDKPNNRLSLEYLYRFNLVFNELQILNDQNAHIITITALHNLFKEIVANETLDFKGEPLKGLQIMGMLESRVLDFETVFICSVNEGILPAGKGHSSFIPYDVKLEHNLPTYKEKDAVYAYHFYRLLQRAKTVYILYNTEPDALVGAEKSRFITQLEIENKHDLNHYVASPNVPPVYNTIRQVKKTNAVMQQLKALAEAGFSPSSLTNYIRNPMDFYYEKVLGIKTAEDIEETVAANTLGSIIHLTLEDLYMPIKGQYLTPEFIGNAIPLIESTIKKHFKSLFKEGDFSKGKNLIIFEIAKRYVNNFLDQELRTIKNGNSIKILALEEKLATILDIPELDFQIRLKGTVDRIDEFNGVVRIIDYKTGKVLQGQVEIVEWEDILTDYDKYSKSFQVLSYAYLFNCNNKVLSPIESGVISFKNLQTNGFLKFAKKASARSKTKDTLITPETLDSFFFQLKTLVIEICDHKIPFTEKLP